MPTAAIVGTAILGAVMSERASSKAAKSQRRGIESAEDAAREATRAAQAQAIPLFASAQNNALMGFQGALDTLGSTIPGQANVMQQGNVAAQQQLLAGLPQFQNATLGNQVDFSQLQPTVLDMPDFSAISNVTLPDFTSIEDALGGSLGGNFLGSQPNFRIPSPQGFLGSSSVPVRNAFGAGGGMGGFLSPPPRRMF